MSEEKAQDLIDIVKIEELIEIFRSILQDYENYEKLLEPIFIKYFNDHIGKYNHKINSIYKKIKDLNYEYEDLDDYLKSYVMGKVNEIYNFIPFGDRRIVTDNEVDYDKEINFLLDHILHRASLIDDFIAYFSREKKRMNSIIEGFFRDELTKLINDFKEQKRRAYELVAEIDKSNQFIKNQEAESVYLNAKDIFDDKAVKYQRLFYASLAITFCLILFYGTPDFSNNQKIVAFVLYKLAIFVVGGSLIAYFLKLSSFYHLKSEQAYQTYLELQAFPSYVLGLDEKDKLSLRKDLAPHYFGKNISETMHDRLSNVLQDQVKASTDAIKTATDLMKVPSKTPQSSTPSSSQHGEDGSR
ncbi:hypothetical protein [Acinetobacter johnsonii]|uniref:hypothetical protein n=1 Tax=Acinetobacter johnsonii TaxID=40214 RepID=UPI001F2169BE|nr:hypothetical protein [Acinetobacter johnsonii]UIZ98734.1 hypothetical protein GBN68_12860 [Acinetobacter johnsonii]